MTCPMRISQCTSTIETAVYANRTHGGVRGRELVTPSYSIFAKVRIKRIYLFKKDILWYNKTKKVLLNGGIE